MSRKCVTRIPGPMVLLMMATVQSFGAFGCDSETSQAPPSTTTPAVTVTAQPPPAVVSRLTTPQVDATLRAIFGEDVTIPPVSDSDPRANGFTSVGAAEALWSPRGVESIEAIALTVAQQALSPERRSKIVACTPMGIVDDACASQTLSRLGNMLWRRPLADDELAPLVALAAAGSERLGDFHEGLEFAVAALIQSPRFLFRWELGTSVDADGTPRYDDYEMASRLAFVVWNRGPDEGLLEAAAAGDLTRDETLTAVVKEMLDHPDARRGVVRFFEQWLHLDALHEMVKDPHVYPSFAPTLADDAREETRRLVEAVVFDWSADIRDILTSRSTFINRKLASIYEVPAPGLDGFGLAEMPEWTHRRGILGHVSFLAREAHAASTSPTSRGVFVREQLLCETVPLPPADVDTSIPETSADAPTLKQRLQAHFDNPACSSCHAFVDPIGLAFEHFDGVGRWRDTEDGHPIDPSGQLDGSVFADHRGLAELLAEDPRFTLCVVRQLFRFATGTDGSGRPSLYFGDWHTSWSERGFRFRDLLEQILLSEPFRRPAPPVEESP